MDKEQPTSQAGRPRKYNRKKIARLFEQYIKNEDLPLGDEFCAKYKIPPSTFSEWPEIRELIEMQKAKARATLVSGGLRGLFSPPVVIFTLKNLGMSDRQVVEHAGQVTMHQPFVLVGVKPGEK